MKKLWYDTAWEQYLWWEETDRKSFEKINNLVKDIERGYAAGDNILNGIGDPELLKGNMQGFISRIINHRDRLIYRIRDGVLEIVACYGHYNDK